MTETDQKYAAKIAALLAKAEATDNPAEAEAFSAAAEKLMLKWGIDEAMAAEAAAGLTAAEAIVEKAFKQTGSYHQAWLELAAAVANGLGSLRILQSKGWRGDSTTVYVIGHESDVARWAMLFESLKAQAEGAMKAWWKTERDSYRGWDGEINQNEGFKARRQFLFAFSHAIKRRLVAERRVEVAETTGAELVLVSRAKKVDDDLTRRYPKLGRARGGSYASGQTGYSAGREAGQRANLGGSRAVTR